MKNNIVCILLTTILVAGSLNESISQLTSKESLWVKKNIKPIYSTTKATASNDLDF